MRHTTIILILALGVTAGCTSTKVYDLSDPSDQEAIAQLGRVCNVSGCVEKSAQIDLIDGSEISGYDLRVDADTLFFAVEPDGEPLDAVAVSEIAEVSRQEANLAKTAALLIGIRVPGGSQVKAESVSVLKAQAREHQCDSPSKKPDSAP